MTPKDGAVSGALRRWLRLEGAALLLASGFFYRTTGESWWLFAGLFLVPDLSFACYLAGPRVGAWGYNLCHSTVPYGALAVAGFASGSPALLAVGLIGAAHVGFDRMLGYGLKDATSFHLTHLGPIGPAARKRG